MQVEVNRYEQIEHKVQKNIIIEKRTGETGKTGRTGRTGKTVAN